MLNKIFVYGTLRKMSEDGNIWLKYYPELDLYLDVYKSATIKGKVNKEGAYPQLDLSKTSCITEGEIQVYKQDKMEEVLQILDAIEGVATGLYIRQVVKTIENGEEAYVYEYGEYYRKQKEEKNEF